MAIKNNGVFAVFTTKYGRINFILWRAIMNKVKRKMLTTFTAVLMFWIFFVTVTYGASQKKNLEAWFNNIKIVVNNQQVQTAAEPFIYNDTTYVPIRVISEALNKEVNYNPSTYTITITDKSDANAVQLSNQLTQRIYEIATLNAKISEYEKKIAELESRVSNSSSSSSSSLKRLEDDLNDKYGYYRYVNFKINLYENRNEIEVIMDVDLDRYRNDWNSLSQSQIRSLVENVCADIRYAYRNVTIKGTIEDTKNRKKVVSFSATSSGTVRVDSQASASYHIYDVEDTLNRKYRGDYEGTVGLIRLTENKDSIDFVIEFTRQKSALTGYGLTSSEIERLMRGVYADIQDATGVTDVEGESIDRERVSVASCWTASSRFRFSMN